MIKAIGYGTARVCVEPDTKAKVGQEGTTVRLGQVWRLRKEKEDGKPMS